MCGVVGEVESTLQGIRWFLCIGKPLEARLLEPGELFRVRCLLAQRLPRPAEIFKRRGHSRHRSATVWAAPALASRTHCPASRVWTAPSANRSWERPSVRVV